ncbi:UDP-glucuronic acid decarboxylase 1 [Rhynchospora pubera]|uniref:UDP-glucuronic acid decarboxylase 1 n=1 Tax=Rhynchospora pubera TaxID=906938 RepID=A0AAV8EPP7_9POAL|nr:UDP-glucuronic acid decarboxylase 1 [Rhynchospora pubera]
MGTSELIYRGGHDPQSNSLRHDSPRPAKKLTWLTRSARYVISEHRLTFGLVGMLLTSLFFLLRVRPSASGDPHSSYGSHLAVVGTGALSRHHFGSGSYMHMHMHHPGSGFVGGKVPLGLKKKERRIVVTGGAGFVGSHLVDRLMERGDHVIVVDNFFTGRKDNLLHHLGNPNFELIRHDVVEPILLEVNQIYHLACPASPVHYKYNPVKTIISFFSP